MNYLEHISSFIEATELNCPEHFKYIEKKLLIKAVEYYSKKAATFISSNKELDDTSKRIYVQIVGEWTFHKTIDFVNARLPIKFFKQVLNANYQAISSCCIKNLCEKEDILQVLNSIEFMVKDVWIEEILKLEKANLISKQQYSTAIITSSFDKISVEKIRVVDTKKSENERSADSSKKNQTESINKKCFKIKKIDILCSIILFLILLLLVFLIFQLPYICSEIYKFSLTCEHFLYYLITLFGAVWLFSKLRIKNKVKNLFKEIDKIKSNFKDITNPNYYYNKIPIEDISIGLSESLSSIENENSDLNKRSLCPIIPALRKTYAEQYGYIFPLCQVFVNSNLKDYEFEIYIKQNLVLRKEIKGSNISDTFYDIIISDLKTILFQYVYCLLTRDYVRILLQNCDYNNSSTIYSFDSKELKLNSITYDFVLDVVTNLLREKVSVKNAGMILDKIVKYHNFYKTPDEISERIREDYAIKISNQYFLEDNSISAYVFDEKYESFIKQSLVNVENSKTIVLNEVEENKLISKIESLINESSNKNSVFICDSSIRLPLFRFLSEYFPNITILSHKEITEPQNLVVLDTIKGEF